MEALSSIWVRLSPLVTALDSSIPYGEPMESYVFPN